jgi:hypothetical protein
MMRTTRSTSSRTTATPWGSGRFCSRRAGPRPIDLNSFSIADPIRIVTQSQSVITPAAAACRALCRGPYANRSLGLQVTLLDPAASHGIALTNGLEMHIGN